MQKLDPPYLEIGKRLTAIRKWQSSLNQKDWAELHGFSPTQYNNWENGTRRITVDDAQRLCDRYTLLLDFVYRGNRDGLPDSLLKLL